MEKITDNPGFLHIAETIFLQIDSQKLESCQEVNESWKKILEDPSFWLKKCFQSGLVQSEKKAAWTNAIQILKNSNLEMELLCLLKEFFHWNAFGYTATLGILFDEISTSNYLQIAFVYGCVRPFNQ